MNGRHRNVMVRSLLKAMKMMALLMMRMRIWTMTMIMILTAGST